MGAPRVRALLLTFAAAAAHAGCTASSMPVRRDAGELLARLECHRCHEATPGHEGEGAECVDCHEELLAREEGRLGEAARARLRAELGTHTLAPSLRGVGRLRREWLARYLREPDDVRSHLAMTMPRLPISAAEAALLAQQLAGPDAGGPVRAGGDVLRGRQLLESRACGSCHDFGGVPPLPSPPAADVEARLLAPDLRFTRERLRPETLLAWLDDPASVKVDARMPLFPMTEGERRDVATYILEAPLAVPAPAPLPARLPLLGRPVRYPEVAAKVFKRTCHHCHGEASALGASGFGYAPHGLSLDTYEGVLAGAQEGSGARHSVLAPGPDGVPRMVARLLARHAEAGGRPVPGVTGMPLAYPPLPMEQIQILESWIAQGAPR